MFLNSEAAKNCLARYPVNHQKSYRKEKEKTEGSRKKERKKDKGKKLNIVCFLAEISSQFEIMFWRG